jgi:hypothetical protein
MFGKGGEHGEQLSKNQLFTTILTHVFSYEKEIILNVYVLQLFIHIYIHFFPQWLDSPLGA